MSNTPAKRIVNSRLGVYFAIFASAYVAVILLAMIGEQLAWPPAAVRWAVVLVPLGFYAIIGMAGSTRDPIEFFAAGRRVPAVYNGLAMAFSAFGGTGLVAMTGTLFLVGFDALCLVIGGLAGFVVMGILLAPFFRKFGAYTIPSYLGRRFESPSLRRISAVIVAVPLTLMLVAEIKTAAFAGAFLTAAPSWSIVALVTAALAITLWPGGTRGLTWSSVAEAIAALLALIVPVTIVAVLWTNLPLPQLSYGPLMRALARQEATQGLPLVFAQGFTFDLPGAGLSSITKRFATTFGAVGPQGFVTAMLTIMAGVAVAPWLLPRVATAPGVYHARKSIGWATLVFGLLMLTAAGIAVYMRVLLFDATSDGTVPAFVLELASRGYTEIDAKAVASFPEASRSALASIAVLRDAVLLMLPSAAGLPGVFVAFAVAGAIAATLAGGSAAATALGSLLAEDIVHGGKAEPPPDGPRLTTARLGIAFALASGGAGAAFVPGDAFDMLLWALALTGSTLFPVLVMSIWWKRINAFGATAGIASGFGVALLAIIAGELQWLPVDPSLAGLFGIPASCLAAIAATLATPHPGRHMLELVRDIRVPGGEILYDREMRLLQLKKRQRTSTGA